MNETANIPPIVLGAVIMCACGVLCGVIVSVRGGALNGAAWFLVLLAGLFGLLGLIVGGAAGAIWDLSGRAPQLSAPLALVAILKGVVKGGAALGGLGLLLGLCVAAWVYQDLENSYVRIRQVPRVANIMLILVILPMFILGIVGGGILAVLRRTFR